MLESLQYVTTALTLVAYLAALLVVGYLIFSRRRERLIRTAPPAKRAELIKSTLIMFDVKTAGLSPEHQYKLALEQIAVQQHKYRIGAIVAVVIAVLLTVLVLVALQKQADSSVPPGRTGGIPDTPPVSATSGSSPPAGKTEAAAASPAIEQAPASSASIPTRFEDYIEIYKGPQAEVWSDRFSAPSTVCTPDKPEHWTIKSATLHLESNTGRSTCGAWTTCSGEAGDTPRRACRSITVQGYQKGEYDGWGRATPVLTVTWNRPVP